MDLDPDTFLTTVYVEIDTFCAQHPAPVRRGPHPRMSDSEVLTVMLVGQWHGTSERGTLAWIAQTYHAAFPVLLSPSAFNRRARRLAGLVTTLLHDLAQRLAVWEEWFEIVDGLPVPLAAWTRGKRRKCFPPEEADLGYGGTDKSAYYGISLMLCVTGSGVITGLVTAPANNAERWSLSALLAWRHDPTVVPMGIEAIPVGGQARAHARRPGGPSAVPGDGRTGGDRRLSGRSGLHRGRLGSGLARAVLRPGHDPRRPAAHAAALVPRCAAMYRDGQRRPDRCVAYPLPPCPHRSGADYPDRQQMRRPQPWDLHQSPRPASGSCARHPVSRLKIRNTRPVGGFVGHDARARDPSLQGRHHVD